MNKIIIISIIFILNQIELNLSQENNGWQNLWDLLRNFGNENCPQCSSTKECYAECDSNQMRKFTGISNWADCKDKCLSLGGNFAYKFDKTRFSDRGCAMYSQRDLGTCVCIPGRQFACRQIAAGSENCPQCSSAPECLSECDSDKRREFQDIADYGDCKDKCTSLGGKFTFKWGTSDNDRSCAIYAKYDNLGAQGKCVCVKGDSYACDNTEFFDAPPAILPPDMDAPFQPDTHKTPDMDTPEEPDNYSPPDMDRPSAPDSYTPPDSYNPPVMPAMPVKPAYPAPETRTISYEMIEGYGIGVVSTLFILLIGICVACLSRRRKSIAKPVKVNYIDTEDERVVINNQINE